MITIDKKSYIGKGNHREVYRHPENNKLCVKIVFDGSENSRQVIREKSYYKHLEKRNISWEMLSRYHGDVITDMGPASVFELITDHDDEVSKTLEYYISESEITEAHYDELRVLLYEFRDYLASQRIITKTLDPGNIVCQKNEQGIFRLSVIDNIGNLDLIPISNYIDFLAQKKIHRRWIRFEKKLRNEHSDNAPLMRILDKL